MPELRKGVRRGRPATLVAGQNCVKTRAAVAREAAAAAEKERPRPRTRLAAKKLKAKQEGGQEGKGNKKPVIVISEKDCELERKEKGKKVNNNKKMGDDSGGLSANKAAGQEEEGSTAPFPERVCFFFNQFLIFLIRDLNFIFGNFVNWVGV